MVISDIVDKGLIFNEERTIMNSESGRCEEVRQVGRNFNGVETMIDEGKRVDRTLSEIKRFFVKSREKSAL